MPLSWNEIRSRAHEFSKRWEGESSERAEAQSFWNEFFSVFGIERKRVAVFEKQVEITRAGQKLKHGRIDAFWKGVLLIEHKSLGQDLSRAFAQAADYFDGLAERDLPRYILASDFARFRLYDLEENTETEFRLADLHENIKRFGFIAGYQTRPIKPEDPVNIEAAERMGKLHDALKAIGYDGHPLEVYLVRLLFCLFAEDTGIFQRQQFKEYIQDKTAEDGSDLAAHLAQLFEVLNIPKEKRLKNLDEHLAAFEYVNGKLFEEHLPTASFDARMRNQLLDCCALDWSRVSPAIFGSLFQSVMNKEARRNLGAHYTSEANILKLVTPLFLDDLRNEFDRCKGNPKKLSEFHGKLKALKFLDPACGCGNFLVIAYRELRLIELGILRELYKTGQSSRVIDVGDFVWLDVDQFYGIEIEEFPAQIAQVAMWLTDHQMNQLISEEFGNYFARLPLKKSATIVCGNALQLDWRAVATDADYILGNPPFVGKKYQSKEQKADLANVFAKSSASKERDYVTGWFEKAARYILKTKIKCGFVATNSISQGEQAGILWGDLMTRYGIKIHFAHRTFKWGNDARGKAAVHCVIVGFAAYDTDRKILFEYEDISGCPHAILAKNINPYLADAPDVILPTRRMPFCNVPAIFYGNMANDGGHLILSDAEKNEFLRVEPNAQKWIKAFVGADEFINNTPRWCLWLKDITPQELRQLPEVSKRVMNVRETRLASTNPETIERAAIPHLFWHIAHTGKPYLLIPRTSSENRPYIPIGYMPSDVIASDANFIISDATLYHFGMLTSAMHMAWVRYTCGRLKSDYRYSNSIVYNNYPWPDEPTDKQRATVEAAAQAVLDARTQFPQSSLADLYDSVAFHTAIPLVKAHQALDRAVDACYRKAAFANDAQRVEFLFERYQQLTSLLPSTSAKKTRKSKV